MTSSLDTPPSSSTDQLFDSDSAPSSPSSSSSSSSSSPPPSKPLLKQTKSTSCSYFRSPKVNTCSLKPPKLHIYFWKETYKDISQSNINAKPQPDYMLFTGHMCIIWRSSGHKRNFSVSYRFSSIQNTTRLILKPQSKV